jgi:hypothetical protein
MEEIKLRVSPDHCVHYGENRGVMGGVSRPVDKWICQCGASTMTTDSGVLLPSSLRCSVCGNSPVKQKG